MAAGERQLRIVDLLENKVHGVKVDENELGLALEKNEKSQAFIFLYDVIVNSNEKRKQHLIGLIRGVALVSQHKDEAESGLFNYDRSLEAIQSGLITQGFYLDIDETGEFMGAVRVLFPSLE